MGAPNIKTGLNTAQPVSFAVAGGVLIGTNGIDPAFRWDGMTAAVENAGVPTAEFAPNLSLEAGTGGATAGDYVFGYRYIDDDITFVEEDTPGPQPGSLSPLLTRTAVDDEKFIWISVTPSTDTRVTGVQFWRSTSGQATTLYLIATIGHNGTITSTSDNGGKVRFTLPTGHGLIVGAKFEIAGHSVAGYNILSFVVTAAAATTVDTDVNYTASGTGGTWVIEGYSGDDDDDATVAAGTAMPINLDDGTPNARRFGVPPNFKAVAVPFQDRMFYGVNVEYNTGTVAVTNGSTGITGTGTNWTTAMVGRYFVKKGDAKRYLINAVASSTSLTVTAAYAGSTTSGSSYAIAPSPEEDSQWYYSEVGEPESVPDVNTVKIQNNTGRPDTDVGAMQLNSALYILQTGHLYLMRFNRQPNIDATFSKAADRGAFNHRCWDVHENSAFLMDRMGPYQFAGGAQPIGAQIQDIWRDGTIDFSKSKWFFVKVDAERETVKFFVVYTADGSTRPKRALCYHIRSQRWWGEKYPRELSGAADILLSGRQRVVVGCEDDMILLASQGNTDIITAQVRGTATASGATTLTDSTANFSASIIGAPVFIVQGTGKAQSVRYITARTSTQITVNAAWDTNPGTDSVYLIGGIEWSCKTGIFDYINADRHTQHGARVIYQPTPTAGKFDIRRYLDHRATPENWAVSMPDTGDSVETTADNPDAVVNMLSTKDSPGQATGYVRLPLNVGMDDETLSTRFSAIEMRGYQGDDPIVIYELEMEGVK